MFSLHSITKAFYEAIRLQLIADGRLVDYTLYTTANEYQVAKNTLALSLKASKQTVVEVYKPSEFRKEAELKGSRISIELNQVGRGDVGMKNHTRYTKNDENGTSFSEHKLPSYTRNLEYEITTFATSNNDDFYMIELLNRVFNNGEGSMKGILSDNSKTANRFNYEETMPLQLDSDDSAIRRYTRFEVKNVNISIDKVIATAVPPFSTFALDLVPYFNSLNVEDVDNGYPPIDPLPPPVDDCATYEIELDNEVSKFVQHNLGYFPLIQIIDDLGNSIVGDVIVIDENRFTVSFNTPVTGKIIFGKLTTLYDNGFYNTII